MALQHYPVSMVRYGQNLYGENLYRLVLARTRTSIESNGDGTFSDKPTYPPHMADMWILERWQDPWEFTQMSKAAWDRGPFAETLGPYPSRGEYVRCDDQLVCSPTEANLDVHIKNLERGRELAHSVNGHRLNRQALKAQYDAETEANRSSQASIIDNAFSAFLNRPFVSTMASPKAAKRGTKTFKFLKSANELGLPTTAGKSFNIPNRNRGNHGVQP